jgi:hypothetical protein
MPKWDDAFLDKMRTIGDPFADRIVKDIFALADPCAAWGQAMLLDTRTPPEISDLPLPLQEYLFETDKTLQPFVADTVGGHRLYEQYEPLLFFVLATYSLPASYAAKKGVQVLHRTTFVEMRPDTRLAQTALIVKNILKDHGIRPGARGMRSIQKARLIHAAIRFLINDDKKDPWPEDELGVPINQEDLAGTLMVFSYLILDGLEKLGIEIPEDDKRGFMETWGVIGRLMGIENDLIPATFEEAQKFSERIQERQVKRSPEGRDAVHALLNMLESQGPRFLRRWPAAAMRFFLPLRVANQLGIPFYFWEEFAMYGISLVDFLLRRDNPFRLTFVRKIGEKLVDLFIRENAEPYKLPSALMGPGKFPSLPCADALFRKPQSNL